VYPSPAIVADFLLVLAAVFLIALTATAGRPSSRGLAITTHAAPGPMPRAHERDPARRTQRRGAGRRTARPAARPTRAPTPAPMPVLPPEAEGEVAHEPVVTAPPQPPETVVDTFYRDLDAGRFEAAWTILTPAVRSAFGGFERWRDGYATTLSNSPRDMDVQREGAVATVAHELVTEDRSPCGPVQRRFAVRWRLVLAADGWRASSLEGAKRAGPEPAEACDARHDAASAAGRR
jgi:hypothetical protein